MNQQPVQNKKPKNPLSGFTDEPLEILKTAGRQIGMEPPAEQDVDHEENINPQTDQAERQRNVDQKDQQALQKLQEEIREISRQKLFNELMQKIQNGEDVYIDQFATLSYEQKDVLKAQVEAVKQRKTAQTQNQVGLSEPATKKGRKLFNFGQKQAAERQQTRVEKPIPPSG